MLGREVTLWCGNRGGDRQIGCKGHCPPPPSGGKQKTRLLVGGDDDDDANVHDDDGDDNAGGGGLRVVIRRRTLEPNPQAHGGTTAIALGGGRWRCACWIAWGG